MVMCARKIVTMGKTLGLIATAPRGTGDGSNAGPELPGLARAPGARRPHDGVRSRRIAFLASGNSAAARRSVGETLRVVRVTRRTPICSSSRRIAWLRPEVEMSRILAALVKLRSSATVTNSASAFENVLHYCVASVNKPDPTVLIRPSGLLTGRQPPLPN